jgi:hypothetical protein
MSKSQELASLLRELARYLEERPEHEVAGLLERARALVGEGRPKKKPFSARSEKGTVFVQELAIQLRSLASREQGDMLLRQKTPNRDGLEALARYLQLPVQRDDTLERLRAKIVENVIGSRLRSEAILGAEKK